MDRFTAVDAFPFKLTLFHLALVSVYSFGPDMLKIINLEC